MSPLQQYRKEELNLEDSNLQQLNNYQAISSNVIKQFNTDSSDIQTIKQKRGNMLRCNHTLWQHVPKPNLHTRTRCPQTNTPPKNKGKTHTQEHPTSAACKGARMGLLAGLSPHDISNTLSSTYPFRIDHIKLHSTYSITTSNTWLCSNMFQQLWLVIFGQSSNLTVNSK